MTKLSSREEPRARKVAGWAKDVLTISLLERVRLRYPWLSNRVLHLIAFRPEYFAQGDWGKLNPLYHRREVQKGNGRVRILHVPCAPLRRIQKCLLATFLNRAMELHLHRNVFGCRPNRNVFGNARRHLLKDFFPSIRFNHVVTTLESLEPPMPELVDLPLELLDSLRSLVARFPSYPWVRPTAVLVARLVTWHGRLPQGAPTSPAIANLVFHRYDRRIAEELEEQGFLYSRYVDDLTISLGAREARSLRLETPDQVRQHVLGCVTRILQKSGFVINHRKVRVSILSAGHRITGLRVTADQIDLPRRLKRRVRALAHELARHGLVGASQRPGQRDSRALDETQPRGPDGMHYRRNRRMSSERLATLMLKRLIPGLKIEMMPTDDAPDRLRDSEAPQLIEGHEVWPAVERILNGLWRGAFRAGYDDSRAHIQIHDAAGRKRCQLRDASDSMTSHIGFFLLGEREAIESTELWHHARGVAARLRVPNTEAVRPRALDMDPDPCFANIRYWHGVLCGALDSLRPIGPLQEPSRPTEEIVFPRSPLPPGSGPAQPITVEDLIRKKAGDAVKQLHQFLDYQKPVFASGWPYDAEEAFERPASAPAEFKIWLHAARQLFVELPPHLPADEPIGLSMFQALCILDERLQRLRCPRYRVELRLLDDRTVDQLISSRDFHGAQIKLADDLCRQLEETNKQCVFIGGQKWQASLVANLWREPLETRLRQAAEAFRKVHLDLTSSDSRPGVFRQATHDDIVEAKTSLGSPIKDNGVRDAWRGLFETGHLLTRLTSDNLEQQGDKQHGENETEQGPARVERFLKRLGKGRKVADIIFKLRHRRDHADDPAPKRWNTWQDIQEYVAMQLGRVHERPKERGPTLPSSTDLQLTPHEATEAKLHILEDLTAALKTLRQPPPDQPGGETALPRPSS